MGLTGFCLCDPKALSSVLRYNTAILGIVPQTMGEKNRAARFHDQFIFLAYLLA
jgi:hypothetical protein